MGMPEATGFALSDFFCLETKTLLFSVETEVSRVTSQNLLNSLGSIKSSGFAWRCNSTWCLINREGGRLIEESERGPASDRSDGSKSNLARANSEALVNNTCKQKKLYRVMLSGDDNEDGFKTNTSD